ncbi:MULTISPECIES: glutamate ABC transporter substrate-binding protein [Actinosynnema]|uniref:ABC transporter substrate-binding protein n=1 Tax=Actinosynnema pretiosum TaxID=42197 RepID=A0A290Z2B4_9PSEU|nr:glutamate ABC transporter substrate-binding protein [Actinosynnema pretiosum]ATE53115.1 ABC transporter substrate-binding protein [Actinosynnema pretiosum]
MAALSKSSLVWATAAVLALTSCGADDDTVLGRAEQGRITIGVAHDQPGLGLRRQDGNLRGFDIDVARYVATELGVPESGITWVEAPPEDRERLLTSGEVDLVVNGYSITPKRREVVDFAGPYYTAGQDLLVLIDNQEITGPDSLSRGQRLCSVTGTTSAQYVKDTFAKNVKLVEQPRFSECVTALLAGEVDALTTDDVVLAGYAAQNPELLRVVGEPFSEEEYGIGLPKGQQETKDAVTAALRKMVDSGEWKRAQEVNVGGSDYRLPEPPQIAS